MKEELIEMLEELKEELKNDKFSLDRNRQQAAISMVNTKEIIKDMTKGKTLVESFSKLIRSYDDALAKCLDAGAKADDEFMYDFTTHYISTILSMVSNLFLLEDFAKDKDNLAFLKSKVRECLIYIDKL